MKKILSICLLWAISIALWGQTKGNYGGGFNPDNPSNPQEPSVTMKYDFKVTAGKGGSVSQHPSGSQFTKGTQIQLNANPNARLSYKIAIAFDIVTAEVPRPSLLSASAAIIIFDNESKSK